MEPKYTTLVSRIPFEVSEEEVMQTLFSSMDIPDTDVYFFPKCKTLKNPEPNYYGYIIHPNEGAQRSFIRLNNGFEIRPGKQIVVGMKKIPKIRIFVSHIPKNLKKNQLFEKFQEYSAQLKRVIIYNEPSNPEENLGFCFLEYESPKEALDAMWALNGQHDLFGGTYLIFDWAEPPVEPEDYELENLKRLHVRNLMRTVDEGQLTKLFSEYGTLDRVKKIQDYAFIHFASKDDAERAKQALDGHTLEGAEIEINWAKPGNGRLAQSQGHYQTQMRSRMMGAINYYDPGPPMPSCICRQYQQPQPVCPFPYPPFPNYEMYQHSQSFQHPFPQPSFPTAQPYPNDATGFPGEQLPCPAPAPKMVFSIPLPRYIQTVPPSN